ncbi:MAG: serine/threonine-protein phosphatase [Acidobacteria bacterium]|nr:serine/threonine-protein phosphatase [Acidobacteriota bacterium]
MKRKRTGLENKTDKLGEIITLAREQQAAILPKAQPQFEGYQVYGISSPYAEVGGDYWDFFPMHGGSLGLLIADAKGNGFSAAVQVTALKRVFKVLTETNLKTWVKFEILNRSFYDGDEFKGPDFITAVFAELEPEGRVYYVNAGHPYPLLLRGGTFRELTEGGLPIGMMQESGYKLGIERLGTNDVLVMYTDGIVESCDEQGNEFSTEYLKQAILNSRGQGAKEIAGNILGEVHRHTGGREGSDDRTLIVVKRLL